MYVWLVGQHLAEHEAGGVWDFQGIYSTETQAVLACHADNYWVARVKLNEVLPHERVDWPKGTCYYPHLEPRPKELEKS